MNFGGIGMVMGHELTHGFDNQGKKFDKNGNLYEWWEADALENFKIRSQCMADQYQQYTVDVEDMVLHVSSMVEKGTHILVHICFNLHFVNGTVFVCLFALV